MPKDEISRRFAADEKYTKAKECLDRLNTDMFYIRYGDYFSQTCNFLRQKLLGEMKVAKNRIKRQNRKERKREREEAGESSSGRLAQPTPEQDSTPEPAPRTNSPPPSSPCQEAQEMEKAAQMFMNSHWADINEELKKEDDILDKRMMGKNDAADKHAPTPMIRLLTKLTKDESFVAYTQARRSIRYYGKRNELAHSHIPVLLKQGQTIKAVLRMQEDLCDLEEVTCVDQEIIEATETAIFATARLFFKVFKCDKLTGDVYSVVPWPKNKKGNYVRKEEKCQVGYIEPDD